MYLRCVEISLQATTNRSFSVKLLSKFVVLLLGISVLDLEKGVELLHVAELCVQLLLHVKETAALCGLNLNIYIRLQTQLNYN